jgi:ribosome biogenesis GTPase A
MTLVFRPARTRFYNTTTNQFHCSLSTSRQQYEEEYFLHKGLSICSVEAEQRRKWKQVVKPLHQKWTIPPLELPSVPEYEVKALSNIHKRSYDCNTLLEIRDVRLPSSSHHPSFSRLVKHRLHLIAYTHADMIDKDHTRDHVEEWTYKSWPDSRPIFVDTRENLSRHIGKPYQAMYDSLLKHLDEKGGLNAALTVGVPNTGKSSLLLCLLQHARREGFIPKKLKSSPVTKSKKIRRQLGTRGPPQIQDKPGKTRELREWLLREKPKAFFLDVPGLTPSKFFFEE